LANIKSAIKRIKVTRKKTLRNKMLISKMKTLIKKYDSAIVSRDVELSEKLLSETVGYVDSLVSKGVFHKNNADRKKSRLAKKLDQLKKAIEAEAAGAGEGKAAQV
jgi:small subunit ribosomal protein S20